MNSYIVDGEVIPISAKAYARRWKTLVVLSMALLIIGLDNTILNVALPSLQKEFDASTSTLQWIVDSYLLVFAGLLLTMGTLGDRFGRKRGLQAGLAIFGGASLTVLLVHGSAQLIAVRAAMGVGGALIMPATLSTIKNVFPRREQRKAIAIWSAMAAVGVGLGPVTGGLLLEWFDWSSVFLLNVPIAGLALALSSTLVPESRDPRPGAFDIPGAALSIAGLGALVFAIIEAPDRGWTDQVILGSFAVAGALGAVFVRWELHTPDPMLNLSFFRNPRFTVASSAIGVSFFALFGAVFATTQYLQDARGFSALKAGLVMLPAASGLMLGSASSMGFGARIGTTRVMTAGLLGIAGVLSSGLLWTADMSVWPLYIWFWGLSFSMGWVMAPGTASVMSAVPAEKSGVASAMNDVTRQVGGALGTAVVGSLISTFYASRVHEHLVSLPAPARSLAEDSIGQANAVAATLSVADSSRLADAAAAAFSDALGIGFAVGAVCAALGALAVKRWLPAKPLDAAEPVNVPDLEQQAA